MNTIIFQTIRVMAIAGVALFAFTGEVFAAPTLLPTSSLEITNTSAAVRAYIENPDESAVVWFEWSEASSVFPPEVIAMSSYFSSGFFSARLIGLKPGTTYSYRAVAKSGGATVYSPVSSFKTTGGVAIVTTTMASSQAPLGGAPLSGSPVNTNASAVSTQNTTSQASSGSAQTQPVASQSTRNTTKTVATKNPTNTAPSNSIKNDMAKLGATNNTASVAGSGSELLPSTLIGWVALIVVTLFVVLLMTMIFDSTERRKKVRVMKKLNGEEVLIEE